MTGLSRAGFYRWRVPRQTTPVEMELRDAMQKVALEWPAYGYRRITRKLQHRGLGSKHKHVLRMMFASLPQPGARDDADRDEPVVGYRHHLHPPAF